MDRDCLFEVVENAMLQESCIEVEVEEVHSYGAWVTFGGLTGYIDFVEVSWEQIIHPEEVLKVGCAEKVRVLLCFNPPKEDLAGRRIYFVCSPKQAHPEDNPWSEEQRPSIGQSMTGKITSRTDYGAFVSFESGLVGLLLREKELRQNDIGSELTVRVYELDVARKILLLEEVALGEEMNEEA
ncbi:MAG: hypothetical protein CL920_13150 [Deltaproteobacteria bacterium]|jgi:ribosomal protein S1|nr:hypothetical protein [Deltaproteobacteria bacterium]MBU49636.1 hypothetical protein [Deltaproteobacteria bacterium]|tara:strand:- start:23396 stop:23944 length:549 start_codon:yes stop_codon:yes gene_type:complete